MPTITNVRIRDVRDAEILFHAVYLKRLSLRCKRLSDEEKAQLRPGHVYVWLHGYPDPLGGSTGDIQRFTEGRRWGPSKARDSFLLYYEKGTPIKPNIPGFSQPLVKLTYSVTINIPSGPPKKWHLNAYYTHTSYDRLLTLDQIPGLRDIEPPRGMYVCARATTARRPVTQDQQGGEPEDEDDNEDDVEQNVGILPTRSSHARPIMPNQTDSVNALGVPGGRPTPARITLAPLEYLQNSTPRPRDPMDDELLRCFRRCVL
ncbi:hypothetical protein CERSUDRAFT_117787 [Gelatoporia subvermispora B]|uniref:Uncharacterized protein n=1 Tax=Ceriporiopsis subvermispora (strain B) TaxID=914234 RepID=M2R450_CERS8|nr:hypothetical protein CERSUDRAFT_117787 [Gelatoporia subvermispora B]